jgi:hypothetical protein
MCALGDVRVEAAKRLYSEPVFSNEERGIRAFD